MERPLEKIKEDTENEILEIRLWNGKVEREVKKFIGRDDKNKSETKISLHKSFGKTRFHKSGTRLTVKKKLKEMFEAEL